MAANGMRVGDLDREAAVGLLRDAYVAGRLDLDELRGRAAAAYRARTWDDLRRQIADLPGAAALHMKRRADWAVASLEDAGWIGAADPARARRPPSITALIALACLCLIAAAWWPVVIIPWLVLLLPLLVVAGRGLPARRERDH